MNMRSLFVALPRAVQASRLKVVAKASVAAVLGVVLFAQVAIAADDPKTWAGIGWGLGIAADFYTGGRRVVDAQIISGSNIVRVTTDSANVGVSFVLEAHYFWSDSFWQDGMRVKAPGGCKTSGLGCTEVASGPFVAVEIGGGTKATTDAGPITGYALGWMWGFHHPDLDSNHKDKSTSSWNFGVGFRVDPQAKVLGDGFVANQPPPPGETTVRFKTEPRFGLMLLSSFSF
jgi:hypothetical protein